MFPRVIRAAAGPHDLGSGDNRDDILPELTVQSGPDSDTGSSSSKDSTSGYSGSVTSSDSDLDIFHNTPSVCRYSSPLASSYWLLRRKKIFSILLRTMSLMWVLCRAG